MANSKRVDRLNSLLKEVISEVIRKEVKHPEVSELFSVTKVEVTKDLHHAKVFVSVIGESKVKEKTITALESSAGFIGVQASKKVVLRYFPSLTFRLDDSVDKHVRIDEILKKIEDKKPRPL